MRHLKLSAAICLSLMVLIMSVPVSAQDARYWPGYHEGAERNGWNPEVRSQNPSALDLIWVFPNPTSADARMYDGVVDDNDVVPLPRQGLFNPGAWGPQVSDTTVNAWNDAYYRMAAQYDPKVDKDRDGIPDGGEDFLAQNRNLKDPVTWQIAGVDNTGQVLDGSYRVYVWFPTILGTKDPTTGAMLTPTKYAHYRVTDTDGNKFDYILDQAEGGKWIQLGDRSFRSETSKGLLIVQLERITQDALHPQNPINNPTMPGAADVFVIADAVKFVSDTGREIWASPSAGTLSMGGVDTPMVFVGTIEGPTASGAPGVDSLGAMYAVYSYNTPTPPDPTNPSQQQSMLGSSLWKYPLDVDNPTTARPFRNPVEGPIGSMYEEHTVAGVFSSPVFAQLPSGMTLPDGTNKVVIFGATDRQIYCLNATTGELVWKGPGLTVPETPNAAWTGVNDRNDAFGGSYLRHQTTSGGADTMVWNRGMPYRSSSDAWKRASYSVYAWIPAHTAGEPRPVDATYNVYHCYEDASGDLQEYDNPSTVTVKLDGDEQGTWVLLGNDYWEPTKVELQTTSKQSGTYVVADAVMFLPNEIRNFSYSSPMVNFLNNPSSSTPESIEVGMPAHVFVGNTGGHVYSLSLTNFDPVTKTTELEWTFPRLQKGWKQSKSIDAQQPGLGPISSSVTVDTMAKCLYVTSTNGHVYKIVHYDGRDPKTETDPDPANWTKSPSLFSGGWVYPSQNPDYGAQILGTFTASPAIGNSGAYIYAACTDGRLYRMTKAAGNSEDPSYPPTPSAVIDVPVSNVPQPPPDPPQPVNNPPADEAGVGAFRYATPAVFSVGGQEVVIAASTDGRVYAFDSDGTGLHKRPEWDHGIGTDDYRETATNVYSSMQASPAIDGGYAFSPGSEETLYVGCQNGCVWWMGARTGLMPTTWDYAGYQTEATDYGVFASPAIANDYVYFGGTDGRLYAFSSSAWGGQWAGPPGMKPGRRQRRPDPTATNSVQVDIFSYYDLPGTDPIYQETYNIWKADQNAIVDTNLLNTVTGGKGIWRSNIRNNRTDSQDAHKYAWRNSGTSSENLHFVEWGEYIDVIAWNIHETDDKSSTISKGAIKFNMNNASSGSGSGMSIPSKPAEWIMRYQIDETPVRYAYAAGARIPIGQSSNNPPSPGSGWIITCTVRDGGEQSIGIVPQLTGSGTNRQLPTTSEWPEQKVGVNNPLGIYTKSGLTEQKLGWASTVGSAAREDPTAHFNGNVGETVGTGVPKVLSTPWPTLAFGKVDHGTDSTAQPLGIMDRSAYSLIPASPRRTIDRFRIQSRDLHWLGGSRQIINPLPWDWPPPYQKDYPDVYQRYESYNQYPDGSDPSMVRTSLLPAIPSSSDTSYDNCKLQPQAVSTTVSVPRYQPANLRGYANTMTAFVDSNRNNVWDSGDVISGRVTTYQEAYREFNMNLWVPPDFRMSVDESTVDVGAVPHGFGEAIPVGPKELKASNSYLPSGLTFGMDRWFKPVTVKNLGNVNLTGVQLAKYPLFRDSGDISFPIPDNRIRSSLDDPFFAAATDGFLPAGNATISKARVGDVDPTVFTLPDTRAFEYDWNGIKEANIAAWKGLFAQYNLPAPAGLGDQPVEPKISVGVPLSQPRGIYGTRLGFVSGLSAGTPLGTGFTPPMSQPFVVTVDVREDRLTDGFTAGALPMVDDGARDVVGDVQPAAWRDSTSGNIYMIWASNRFGDNAPVTPEDPWYLLEGALDFNSKVNDWTSTFAWTPETSQWWRDPNNGNFIPSFKWPDNDPWLPDLIENSIKHTSPYIAVDRFSDPPATWLFWQGQADFKTGTGSTPSGLKREYRIFYTSANDGKVAGPGDIYSFAKDPTQVKMQPRAVTYLDPSDSSKRLMWLFWYGGDNGRWQLYFCRNVSPASGHDPNAWSSDGVLPTPAALAAVSEPTPILRQIADTDEGPPVKPYIDMVYTGLFKEGQNSDILMTRYKPVSGTAKVATPNPKMPRQYGEVLKRDPKRNVFTSAHIGWVKPGLPATPKYDHTIWNTPNAADYTNRPFIKVVIPAPDPDQEPTVLFATSGAQKGYGPVTISRDRATGNYIYTYNTADPAIDPAVPSKYPNGKRQAILGQMIVDPSGGVVRFGKVLAAGAKVVAEYTPQALRITRGPEVDASPFAFLEKTENMNPGFSDTSSQRDRSKNNWRTCPVDRLWVFWRKPNVSGVQTSTIYYKTYRFTLDLPVDYPIAMQANGKPIDPFDVSGNLGPFEVDPTGSRIYFTEKDERYAALNRGLPPITVTYQARDVNNGNKTVEREIVVDGLWTPDGLHNRIVWQQELPKDRPDQALLGYGADTQKNEGQVCAFADVWPEDNPWYKNMPANSPFVNSTPTRIWVFWMSTRAGNTDLYYETLCPDLRMKGQ